MKETGIADQMIIGPEFEFHLLDHVSYECKSNKVAYEVDTDQAQWNTGENEVQNFGYQVPQHGGYHVAAPQDITYDIRSRMCLCAKAVTPNSE